MYLRKLNFVEIFIMAVLLTTALSDEDPNKLVRKDRKISYYRLIDALESFPKLVSLSESNFLLRPFIHEMMTFTPVTYLELNNYDEAKYSDRKNTVGYDWINLSSVSVIRKRRSTIHLLKDEQESLIESSSDGLSFKIGTSSVKNTLNDPLFKMENSRRIHRNKTTKRRRKFRNHLNKSINRFISNRKSLSTTLSNTISDESSFRLNKKIKTSTKTQEITSLPSQFLKESGTLSMSIKNNSFDQNSQQLTHLKLKVIPTELSTLKNEPIMTSKYIYFFTIKPKFNFKFSEEYSESITIKSTQSSHLNMHYINYTDKNIKSNRFESGFNIGNELHVTHNTKVKKYSNKRNNLLEIQFTINYSDTMLSRDNNDMISIDETKLLKTMLKNNTNTKVTDECSITESINHMMAPRQLSPRSRKKSRTDIGNFSGLYTYTASPTDSFYLKRNEIPSTIKYHRTDIILKYSKVANDTGLMEKSTPRLKKTSDLSNKATKKFKSTTYFHRKIPSNINNSINNYEILTSIFFVTQNAVRSNKGRKNHKTLTTSMYPFRYVSILMTSQISTNVTLKKQNYMNLNKDLLTTVSSSTIRKKNKKARTTTNNIVTAFVNVNEEWKSVSVTVRRRKTNVFVTDKRLNSENLRFMIKRIGDAQAETPAPKPAKIECFTVGLPCIQKICFLLDVSTCSTWYEKGSTDTPEGTEQSTELSATTATTKTNNNDKTKGKITNISSPGMSKTEELSSKTNKVPCKPKGSDEDPLNNTVFRLLLPTLPTIIGLSLILSGILFCTKISRNICSPFVGIRRTIF